VIGVERRAWVLYFFQDKFDSGPIVVVNPEQDLADVAAGTTLFALIGTRFWVNPQRGRAIAEL
jgi:hypothetical protein